MVPPGLLYSDGAVQVNTWLRTGNPDIFAVGDIAKYPSVIL
jgi:NADPH-dependent 2,4-dienoyl-CoA reductase/sulfur reductase-like enzyme